MATRPADPNAVVAAVAEFYRITPKEIRGTSRKGHIIPARAVAYQLLHDLCGWSWPTVGDYMGRDHTTAITVSRKADPQVVKLVTRVVAS